VSYCKFWALAARFVGWTGHARGPLLALALLAGVAACSSVTSLSAPRREASRIRPPAEATASTAPVIVRGLREVIDLAVGPESACAVTRRAELRCWSLAAARHSMHASAVVGLSAVSAVAVSRLATCVLRRDANVVCFSHAAVQPRGPAADDDDARRRGPPPLRFGFAEVPDTHDAIQISMHEAVACAVMSSGKSRCWQIAKKEGLAGQRLTTLSWRPADAAHFEAIGALEELRLGARIACARNREGAVYWWAPKWAGAQESASRDTAEDIAEEEVLALGQAPRRLEMAPASAIASGAGHACATTRMGRLHCWGGNFYGQLGTGTRQSSSKPQPVVGLMAVARVAAGTQHTCAVDRAGRAYCWGRNVAGRLGDGSYRDRLQPVQVGRLSGVTALEVGDRSSCALRSNGTVYCWGAETERHCFDCAESQSFPDPQ
jgi:hypothetical protein